MSSATVSDVLMPSGPRDRIRTALEHLQVSYWGWRGVALVVVQWLRDRVRGRR